MSKRTTRNVTIRPTRKASNNNGLTGRTFAPGSRITWTADMVNVIDRCIVDDLTAGETIETIRDAFPDVALSDDAIRGKRQHRSKPDLAKAQAKRRRTAARATRQQRATLAARPNMAAALQRLESGATVA